MNPKKPLPQFLMNTCCKCTAQAHRHLTNVGWVCDIHPKCEPVTKEKRISMMRNFVIRSTIANFLKRNPQRLRRNLVLHHLL